MAFIDKLNASFGKRVHYTSEDHRKFVDACMRVEERTRELTEWEEEFIQDMDALLRLGGHLNRKQEVILERIYAEKTP